MTANVSCQSSAISCHQCRLASLCLPPSLNQQELSEVDFLIQQRPILDKDQILYRLNDAFGAIYAVRSGCVKTTILTEEGDEKITGFYLPGDIVGMEGISDKHYHNTAVAIDKTSLCQIPFDTIEQLASRIPELQRQLFKVMSREIVSDQYTMLTLNKNKAQARIAAFFMSLSSRYERQGLCSIRWSLPMSRSELGNYLGLTIETVSRVLTHLHKQQIIEVNKHEVSIIDANQLKAIASEN